MRNAAAAFFLAGVLSGPALAQSSPPAEVKYPDCTAINDAMSWSPSQGHCVKKALEAPKPEPAAPAEGRAAVGAGMSKVEQYHPQGAFKGPDGNWHPKDSFVGPDGYYHPKGAYVGPDGNWHPEGSFVGKDGKYHPKGAFLGPDGLWHPEGSFLGKDGLYHPKGSVLGKDGRYHPAGATSASDDGKTEKPASADEKQQKSPPAEK